VTLCRCEPYRQGVNGVTLEIIEITGRSAQGATRPYICIGSDGATYVVKGRSATRSDLINEWLCANLAEAFGLPVAPFAIAEVPQALMDEALDGWVRDLGSGPVFASQRCDGQELSMSQVDSIDPALRRDLVAFDWWIRNNDRHLTDHGGNVNLLWQPRKSTRHALAEHLRLGTLTVFDHNLALDLRFDRQAFCETHVFIEDFWRLLASPKDRAAAQARLALTMAKLEDAWQAVPQAWQFIDPEETLPTAYPIDAVRALLGAVHSPDFWPVKQ
jgi:hypothetical protein